MENLKHTQGEWIISQSNNIYSGSQQICALPSTNDEYKANAKLISAAPDLLEALIVATSCLREDISPIFKDGFLNAIKKATE